MDLAAIGLGKGITMHRLPRKKVFFFILGIFWTLPLTDITARTVPPTYQAPFSGTEIRSTHITPFFKWTGVVARIDARKSSPKQMLNSENLLKSLIFNTMVESVNDSVNRHPYISDLLLWGVSDYWATPTEFFAKGGDCEDFAIAKYDWLRFLGVPDDHLRIAIVHDRIQNMPHAVLILYINGTAMVLDNQIQDIRDSRESNRYRMIYSINRTGWWLPRKSKPIAVSAADTNRSQIEPASGIDTLPFSKTCLAGDALAECINTLEPSAGR